MRHVYNILPETAPADSLLVVEVITPEHPRYRFSVIASGLDRPVGITVEGSETVFFTVIPTPGVAGGANGVAKLDLESGEITMLHVGEPEPTHIALDNQGDLYWTCKSAGVILRQTQEGTTDTFLSGLEQPSGISVSRFGHVYFTEIPNPGIPNAGNRVSVTDGNTKVILHQGEPEPTDVVVSRGGSLYWTCKSAGVILQRVAHVPVSFSVAGLLACLLAWGASRGDSAAAFAEPARRIFAERRNIRPAELLGDDRALVGMLLDGASEADVAQTLRMPPRDVRHSVQRILSALRLDVPAGPQCKVPVMRLGKLAHPADRAVPFQAVEARRCRLPDERLLELLGRETALARIRAGREAAS